MINDRGIGEDFEKLLDQLRHKICWLSFFSSFWDTNNSDVIMARLAIKIVKLGLKHLVLLGYKFHDHWPARLPSRLSHLTLVASFV